MRCSPLLLSLALVTVMGCSSPGAVLQDFDGDGSLDADDCGPDDDTIHPGAPDSFGDGIDQDCDGSDGVDADRDGYASIASGGNDCSDDNPNINPNDADQDGYSTCTALLDCDDSDASLTPLDADGDHYSSCTGDCDDGNSQMNPEQQEVCDLLDNDCDGVQADDEVDIDLDGDPACNDCDDNNELLDGLDLDNDSFSLCDGDCIDDPAQAGSELIYPAATDLVANDIDNNCDGIPGTDADGDGSASEASGGDDCDDTEATTNPAASDTVGDGIDNNCDGIDGVDADGDLFASLGSGGADCDDLTATSYPGAADVVADGIDSNCDGIAGTDDDGDGSASEASGGGDCNDSEPTTHPTATDTVGDTVDNNCDGTDGVDADGDQRASLASLGDDCNDDPTDPFAFSTFPGAADSWGNGIDEDCDLCVDPDPTDTIVPGDGIDTDCDGFAYNGPGEDWDCNDSEATVHPSATDTVGDDVDNNCDHIDGVDADGDLHASEASGGNDCDDSAPGTYPGAPDILDAAGIDTDCDLCDPTLPQVWNHIDPTLEMIRGDGIDADCDGYPQNGGVFDQDCDDNNASIYPGSAEIWESTAHETDTNCDGYIYNPLGWVSTSFLGESSYDNSGSSVSSAGDVDGDGLSDLLIGAHGNDTGGGLAGKTYLFLGSSLTSGGTYHLNVADASFVGENGSDKSGVSVSSAGDVDGDGLDDLLIGAHENDDGGNDAGKTYLFLAASMAAGGTFDLSTAHAAFVGENAGDQSGSSVTSAGDVDGDGLSDLLIGAYGSDDGGTDAGKTYLFLAASIVAGGTFHLSAADASFVGEQPEDTSGASISSAGDVDGDGLSDILIGAEDNDDAGSNAGKTYLFLGSSLTSGGTYNLSAADASFLGEHSNDWSGSSVSAAGDVDGDGLSDILIGAFGNDTGGGIAGKTYLFTGLQIAAGGVFDLSSAHASFIGEHTGDWSGHSTASAGDVDGDGLADLLIGAMFSDEGGSNAGKTYLIPGSSVSSGGTFDLSSPNPLTQYFVGEEGEDHSAASISSAGDVNGDGLTDLLIGAPDNDESSSRAGKSYLILSAFPTPDYAGLWTLGSTTTYSCLSGAVSADLAHLNITYRPTYAALDPTLIANAYELTMDPRSLQPGLLQGGFVTSATPDSFALSRTESLSAGACTATWALTGSYTGPDTLSADFTATFTGSCGDCTNQSLPVTATR